MPSGNPLGYDNFRALFPETSFPSDPTLDALADFGYAPYRVVPAPAPSGPRKVVDAGPVTLDGDAYAPTYVERDMTSAEAAVVEAAQVNTLRAQRNTKLAACDWTQLPDVVLTPAEVVDWRTYRQALRDYMSSVVDPFAPPAWPVPPS